MPAMMRRILMIDDEPAFCGLVELNLQKLGHYQVVVCSEAMRALRLALELKPDLILLDLLMPGANGLDLLKQLKENPKTAAIPVIVLTAVTDGGSKQQALFSYCDGYLEKPVELRALQSKIEQVLTLAGHAKPEGGR